MGLKKNEKEFKGLFVVLEGGEGAGKTTLLHKLEAALQAQGFCVVATREPGGCLLSEKIRALLLDPELANEIDPHAELLLFLSARAQHVVQKILPALRRGEIVLCDRFRASTIAYQGFARGLGADMVEQLSLWSAQHTVADLTFYLDLPLEIGHQRVQQRLEPQDRMEQQDASFHQAVRQGFLHLAQKYAEKNFIVIQANRPVEEVYQEAWQALQVILQRADLC